MNEKGIVPIVLAVTLALSVGFTMLLGKGGLEKSAERRRQTSERDSFSYHYADAFRSHGGHNQFSHERRLDNECRK